MSDPIKCKECGSTDLGWFTTNVNKTNIAEGRLRTHEPTCLFVLGCHDCSETLKVVEADRVAERMNSEQSELAALREELATVRRGKDNADLALTTQTKNKDRYKQRAFAAEQRLAAAEQRIAELKHELELSERGRIAVWRRSEEMATARDCIATNYNQLSYGATACKEKLVSAEQHIAELTDLIEKAHTWVDRNNCGGWDAYELRDQLAAALAKPTESGASE